MREIEIELEFSVSLIAFQTGFMQNFILPLKICVFKKKVFIGINRK